MASPFPCCTVNRECHVKENPDQKIYDAFDDDHCDVGWWLACNIIDRMSLQ